MLDTILENKIIYEFLTLYEHSFWKKLIPSLLEIAILNLKSSFNTLIFSEKDIDNIIKDLKEKKKIIPNFNKKPTSIKDTEKEKEKEHIIFYKPSTEWRTIEGWGDPDYLLHHRCCHSWKHSNKTKQKHLKSKIKNFADNDKRNYYYTSSENNIINFYNINPKKRVNYAISYDKNLVPEIIESKTVKESEKGEKKIIQRMTHEEYEKKCNEYNQNNDENDGINNEKNKTQKLFQSLGQKKIKYIDININERNLSPYNSSCSYNYSIIKTKNRSPVLDIQNKKRNDLYHYKINYSTQRNKANHNLIQNTKMSNYGNYKSGLQNNLIELNANSIKNFGKHYFKNENSSKKPINKKYTKIRKNNKYINLENYSNEEQNDKIYTYNNNNIYLNRKINNQKYAYGERSSDSAQNSEFIGIDKKYEKKIDELEKNILNTNNNLKNKKIKNEQNLNQNNIENFSNKLKVNIINMEDYALKKKNKKKNIKRNELKSEKYEKIDDDENATEIIGEKKEQNLNNEGDNYNNEKDFIIQKSNMAGKKQLINKK